MQKLRSISITVVIIYSLCLFGMDNSSDAIEIVDFPSDTEDYSYGGYTYSHGLCENRCSYLSCLLVY